MATSTLSPEERFFKFVHKSDDPDGCWLWTGGKFSNGYGQFYLGDRRVRAHRFAYECFVGTIPENLWVLHDCDTPLCVNPSHLWLGTNSDNVADRQAKRRSAHGLQNGAQTHPESRPFGIRNGNSKLTTEKVCNIRVRYAKGGITQQQLADEHGVTRGLISQIVRNLAWQHVSSQEHTP